MSNPFSFGIIDGKDYAESIKQGKCRVKLTSKSPGILTKPLQIAFPFAGVDKSYCVPKIGDRVVVLLDAGGDDGVVLGSLYTNQTTPPVDDPNKHHIAFDDGTTLEYDKGSHTLEIITEGDINIIANGNITIAATGALLVNTQGVATINSTGSLSVTGSAINLN